MTEATEEKQSYYTNLRKKTNAILEILKGYKYDDIQAILKLTNNKVDFELRSITYFKNNHKYFKG